MTEKEHGSVAMGDTEAATEKHAKDCLSLATIFRHWMDAGRQPTFSGGDMRHIIKTLENSAAPQPAHGTSATDSAPAQNAPVDQNCGCDGAWDPDGCEKCTPTAPTPKEESK